MDSKFSKSVNNIDERVFEKYYAFEKKLDAKRANKTQVRAKIFAAAACLTIFACIGVTVILPAMKKDNPIDPLLPPNDTATETEHSFLTDSVNSSVNDGEVNNAETATESPDDFMTEAEITTESGTDDNAVTGEAATEEETISGCNHIWKLESEKDSKYKCSKCNAIHFCTNPEDLEKVGNLNESTLIYRCKICGSEHLTTDPDSIKDIYTVEIVNAENFLILNELNHYYSAGEQVTVALETITEHYYMFYVNGVKQSPDESNWSVTYYTFTMPAEDVIITIEDVWVDIPTE